MHKAGRRWMFQLRKKRSTFALPLPFCSFRALNWLDDAHPHGKDESSLLSLLIPMLISSENTLIGTLRNTILPAIWASHGPVNLTHEINHCGHLAPSLTQSLHCRLGDILKMPINCDFLLITSQLFPITLPMKYKALDMMCWSCLTSLTSVLCPFLCSALYCRRGGLQGFHFPGTALSAFSWVQQMALVGREGGRKGELRHFSSLLYLRQQLLCDSICHQTDLLRIQELPVVPVPTSSLGAQVLGLVAIISGLLKPCLIFRQIYIIRVKDYHLCKTYVYFTSFPSLLDAK